MADFDTPIWEVMLQSAQVINQVANLQRQKQADEERIAMREQELTERTRLQEQKLVAQEEKLKAEQARWDAELELKKIKEQRIAEDADLRIAVAQNTSASMIEKRTWEMTKKPITEAKASTAWRESESIVKALDADVYRTTRSGDKEFDDKYAHLWEMSHDQLGTYKKKVDRAEPDALTAIENARLVETYPSARAWDEKKQKELAAIRQVEALRDTAFEQRAEIYVKSEAVSPAARNVLKLRLPSLRTLESQMADTGRPSEPTVKQVGAGAIAGSVTPPAPSPATTTEVTKPFLDKATAIRNRTVASPTDEQGKVSDAAALYIEAYNVDKGLAEQVIREMAGGALDPKNPTKFFQDVLKTVQSTQALRSRPQGARMTSKK